MSDPRTYYIYMYNNTVYVYNSDYNYTYITEDIL
jgi:hypothetical protein